VRRSQVPGACLWSGRSVWVFLAPGRFGSEGPPHEVGLSWICLDSLVRIETFQWITRLEAGKLFSQPFSVALEAPEREPAVLACGRAQLFMWRAYVNF
jgi:hypothetical protein